MKTFKEIKIYEVYVIKYKTRVYYSKGEKRYWSVKDTDVPNVKDAMRFKSGKDAQDELDGMKRAQKGNYEIVKEEVEIEEGYKDLPPHLQKLIKKIEKRQKDWNKQNPRAKIKTLVYNPETGKPDIEVEEGFQEIQNLANLIQSETDRLVKAAKKGDMKTVMAIYRTIGNIIK